ncbi:MAG: carbohydrate binding family 9 domain-containing protein [Sphingobacteriia bacterium]|nr:carbohydrate binding family 9 domain-containing protein [Sphingobacteriia bacterium]
MKRTALIATIIFLSLNMFAQSQNAPKQIAATRTNATIIIDGNINDSAWSKATKLNDFVEWRPDFGKPEPKGSQTEIYLLYDDNAFYIAGFCHEQTTDSISKELVGRDVIGINDFVGVIFDTYNDKINGFGYYVTPLGEQFDAKYSNNGEDASWNSVYESKSMIVKGGWTFEMRIPYSAIRFGNKSSQIWGMNITRRRNKTGQQYMWNPVNPTVGGTFLAQGGLLTNIENIKPPVRLSLSPYLSLYANHYPYNNPTIKNWSNSFNGGMDVKYGINQAFTLDMTLIPDFGQVQSDNQVLNLTPFEVKYNENRNFFTEGTELFNKGNLFYSRRIGGTPLHFSDVYNNLSSTETVVQNPLNAKLINATKISGRTQSGLGMGFFNAVTDAQYATIEDTVSKKTRSVQTSPLTDYNIVVLDQTLKNNSSISFINTSTIRSGGDYDATVSAALWDFYDKKNIWNFSGQFAVSQLYGYENPGKTYAGTFHSLNFSKTGGRFNFNLWQEFSGNTYNQNDLGYFTNNNYLDHGLWVGYKWLKPNHVYKRLYFNFNLYYSRRYMPSDYQTLNINTNINGQLNNLWNAGLFFRIQPQSNDFYEPRVDGRVFKTPGSWLVEGWVSTNRAKKYSTSIDIAYKYASKYSSVFSDLFLNNSYRFNKKLTISLDDNFNLRYNNIGFAGTLTNTTTNATDVYFGSRTRITVENILNIKYNFTNMMGLTFRARHYWSKVDYHLFYFLNPDGSLSPSTQQFNNSNVNFFNIDMVYTWQFALGSFLNIGWKNAVASYDTDATQPYFKNLSNTLSSSQNNTFSVKVIYFLDYLSLKKKK